MQISPKPMSSAEPEQRKAVANPLKGDPGPPGADAEARDEAQTERQAPPNASPGEAAGS